MKLTFAVSLIFSFLISTSSFCWNGNSKNSLKKSNKIEHTTTQEIRDKTGKLIGKIETQPTGVQIGRNARGQKVGEYNLKTNETIDKTGKIVGYGNQLVILMK